MAKDSYIMNTLQTSLEERNTKPFWIFIKSRRLAPLLERGKLYQDSEGKAQVLNRQFSSVFTREDLSSVPRLFGPNYPNIGPLCITDSGIIKLLKALKVNKAAGPDSIACRVLREVADELGPVLTLLFRQSVQEGILPSEWKTAFVTPIFKKGRLNQASNYRPVSLTCVCCKLLEHVICKHIMLHLESHGILTPRQHGFLSLHSCESQLIITLNDFVRAWDEDTQLDVTVLDLSKAFDKVPHQALLGKLQHYGIEGNVHSWITDFLSGRTQRVIVDGAYSEWEDVVSGVPQGTVMGPLLFLLHINDLPSIVSSEVRLFADDCLVYRRIRSQEDQHELQKDLDNLYRWAETWGMEYNPTKCNTMSVKRGRSKLNHIYSLNGHPLLEVQEAKYLGITISNNLKWTSHIQNTVTKANRTLGFLHRNLRSCPKKLKAMAYLALIRPLLEYSCAAWDPYLKGDIQALEKIQRRGARFVLNQHKRDYTSISTAIKDLNWPELSERRRQQRLTMMFKVMNGMVAIPANVYVKRSTSRTRSTNSARLDQLRAHTDIYQYSFFPRTIVDWNSLNDNIVTSPTLDTFKNRLKSYQ